MWPRSRLVFLIMSSCPAEKLRAGCWHIWKDGGCHLCQQQGTTQLKSGKGHSFHRGNSGLCGKQVGHYLMTDCNPDIWRSPISILESVTEPLILDFHLVLITDPSQNTNLIEIGIASQEILPPVGRSFQKIVIPTHLLQPNLLHEDFVPNYKGR